MSHLPPVLYRGSVKNVRGEVSHEFLHFEFTDRYSVFDWGEMPDQLEDKGASLAIMGKSFFQFLGNPMNWKNLFSSNVLKENFDYEYLENLRLSKTYESLCKTGLLHHASLESYELKEPYLKVKNVKVVRPPFNGDSYNYIAYNDKLRNSLVPLEIIFRLGLSPGNSLSKRCGDDLSKWKAFGFNEIPKIGLQRIPVIDFSTKLERGDRYLSYAEAKSISGINDIEWKSLLELTNLVAINLFNFHHDLGLELWDGKVEMAFTGIEENRSFMLVDTIGIDELRLLYKGKSFSKEFLREVYKDSDWYTNLEASKKIASISGEDFKSVCLKLFQSGPEKLKSNIKERAESVYKSYSNAVSMKVFNVMCFSEEFNLDNYNQRYL
ncbi:MAG: hypothetical protein K2Q18_14015 [Bdellovibrionales bacterium]|nr:hypothetical protein [Bdellovibrionales bacterium]